MKKDKKEFGLIRKLLTLFLILFMFLFVAFMFDVSAVQPVIDKTIEGAEALAEYISNYQWVAILAGVLVTIFKFIALFNIPRYKKIINALSTIMEDMLVPMEDANRMAGNEDTAERYQTYVNYLKELKAWKK